MAKRSKACKNESGCDSKNCDANKTCAAVRKQTIPVSVTTAPARAVPVSHSPPPQTLTTDTSPAAIKEHAAAFFDLFDRYERLRVLARKLSGLSQASVYPDDVKIDKVDLTFTVAEQVYTATINGSRIVGELAPLVANELSSIIEQMYKEIFSLTHMTAGMRKAIEEVIAKRPAPTGAIADNSVSEKDANEQS